MQTLINSALQAINAGDLTEVKSILLQLQRQRQTQDIIDPNAKRCPKCGSTCLALFTSLRYKHCNDCGHKWPWELAQKQKPLF